MSKVSQKIYESFMSGFSIASLAKVHAKTKNEIEDIIRKVIKGEQDV